MMNRANLTIETQARIISDLNKTVRQQREEVERVHKRLNEMEPYAEFYKTLQGQILSSPTLMEEWKNFCFLLKMADPDAEKYE